MTIRISREETNLAFPISLWRKSEAEAPIELATATAFIWEHNCEWHLITNVHNASGWDWVRRKALSPSGALPTHIQANLLVVERTCEDTNASLVRRKGFEVPLFEDLKPKWLVHPDHKEQVDVCAIPFCQTPTNMELEDLGIEGFHTFPINKHQWDQFDLSVGIDAFVLGYPLGMNSLGFPIWKRASIATEPEIDLDGLPKFFIDTATRPGMSGAPVICINRGLTMPSGTFDSNSIIGEAIRFAGVYSGRLGAEDEFGAQMGVVWKGSVIEEILASKTVGNSPLT